MMKLLAIETSCDETAVAVLECTGDEESATFIVQSHALISQIDIHREFGGVFPAIAKREHAKNLVPLLGSALEEAELLHEDSQEIADEMRTHTGEILVREPEMAEAFMQFITETERPEIDAIAVTYGPGLEPALWVGITFAQALSFAWNIPLIPVDHMEGHLMMALAQGTGNGTVRTTPKNRDLAEKVSGDEFVIENVGMPLLALLISGGHTEIDLMEPWLSYQTLGQTKDDAVGEAFDKVARMIGLPYPGGPEISRLAARSREDAGTNPITLPRPMIDSPDFNFSFSGLKTAVLYMVKGQNGLSPDQDATNDTISKEHLAHAFEDAAADVLVKKTLKALEYTQAQTLAIGGGVSANAHIQDQFKKALAEKFPHVELRLPHENLTGDNAVMIGIAGFYRAIKNEFAEPEAMRAKGNLRLGTNVL
jgi:N6-L-threonylcarbamoyladenine synthase